MPVRGGIPVTDQQAAVVAHAAGQGTASRATVVRPGAGSGKTHTTVASVLDLVERCGAGIDQFVLITFTEKAADELRARMERSPAERVSQAATEADRLIWQG